MYCQYCPYATQNQSALRTHIQNNHSDMRLDAAIKILGNLKTKQPNPPTTPEPHKHVYRGHVETGEKFCVVCRQPGKSDTTSELEKIFVDNFLDGDAIQGGQMIASTEIKAFIDEYVTPYIEHHTQLARQKAEIHRIIASTQNPYYDDPDEDMPQKKRMTIIHKREGFERARKLFLSTLTNPNKERPL